MEEEEEGEGGKKSCLKTESHKIIQGLFSFSNHLNILIWKPGIFPQFCIHNNNNKSHRSMGYVLGLRKMTFFYRL